VHKKCLFARLALSTTAKACQIFNVQTILIIDGTKGIVNAFARQIKPLQLEAGGTHRIKLTLVTLASDVAA
jgi:hypothetical protein